jgi:autotransporter-associated beta strand protein
VPGAADHAIYSRWADGGLLSTVTLPAATDVANDRLSIRQTGAGALALDVPAGRTWSLTTAAPGVSLAVSEFLGQSNVRFQGGGTVQSQRSLVAGQVGAAGNLTISGTGTFWNNQENLDLGGTSSAAGGVGTLTLLGTANATIGGTLTIRSASSSIVIDTGSTLTTAALTQGAGLAPTITNNGTVMVNGAGNSSFAGAIAGSGHLTKTGGGNFTLTGANPYTGSTNVVGGVLALAGTGSIANSPVVTVSGGTLNGTGVTGGASFDSGTGQFALASGQTLQGNGSLTGGVTARPGSTIRGDTGTSTGELTATGTIVFQGASGTSGSRLRTIVSHNAGFPANPDESSLLVANLDLAISASSPFNIELLTGTVPLQPFQSYTITLATATGAIRQNGSDLSGGFLFHPNSYNLTADFPFESSPTLGVDSLGKNLVLNVTPTPEPGTVLAVAAVGLGLAGLARRRWRRIDRGAV